MSRPDDAKLLQSLEPRKETSLGVVRAVLAALTVYLLPQFLAGFVVAVVVEMQGIDLDTFYDDNSIIINFVFSAFSTVVGLFLVYLLTKRFGGMRAIGLRMIPFKKYFLILPAYIVYFAILVAVFTLIEQFNIGVDLDQEQVVGFESASQNLQLVLSFIALVIFAPVFEEILFRGLLFSNVAARTGFWPAAIVISGLFGLAHQQLNVGIDTFLLGIAASWLVWKTHSVYPAILLHMLKNLVAFLILFII